MAEPVQFEKNGFAELILFLKDSGVSKRTHRFFRFHGAIDTTRLGVIRQEWNQPRTVPERQK